MVTNRVELAKYFGRLGFNSGVEVGVLEGHYSIMLLNNIPGLELHCVDNWKNIANREHIKQLAYNRLSGRAHIVQKHSMDAVKDFKDESLDFVYIDANHQYHSVIDDLTEWTKKVRKGGIIAGDDYYMIPGSKWGVIPAVNHFVKENGYELHVTKWDKSLPEEDSHPQFWFVR